MLIAEICVGVSASGKSTYAQEKCKAEDWVEVNRDNTRFNGQTPDWSNFTFNREFEAEVTRINFAQMTKAFEEGKNIVVSDTNLNLRGRKQLFKKLKGIGFSPKLREFPVDLDEAIMRDKYRKGGVGEDVIRGQYVRWEQYLEGE